MGIELVDRYFWLRAVVVSPANVAVLQVRFGRRQVVVEGDRQGLNPSLAAEQPLERRCID